MLVYTPMPPTNVIAQQLTSRLSQCRIKLQIGLSLGLGLANAPIVETKFLELAMSSLDFSPRIPLGTFSILLH